jgi:hypothetical protein
MVAESIVSYKLLAISEKCFNTTMTRKGFDDDNYINRQNQSTTGKL